MDRPLRQRAALTDGLALFREDASFRDHGVVRG